MARKLTCDQDALTYYAADKSGDFCEYCGERNIHCECEEFCEHCRRDGCICGLGHEE